LKLQILNQHSLHRWAHQQNQFCESYPVRVVPGFGQTMVACGYKLLVEQGSVLVWWFLNPEALNFWTFWSSS